MQDEPEPSNKDPGARPRDRLRISLPIFVKSQRWRQSLIDSVGTFAADLANEPESPNDGERTTNDIL
jgi:hypothetical protein